jgi:hypothetical protein
VGTDEIRTQTQPLAGETDRLLVVSAFFPAAAIGKCDAVIGLGQVRNWD